MRISRIQIKRSPASFDCIALNTRTISWNRVSEFEPRTGGLFKATRRQRDDYDDDDDDDNNNNNNGDIKCPPFFYELYGQPKGP
jgi:hypothetical protein